MKRSAGVVRAAGQGGPARKAPPSIQALRRVVSRIRFPTTRSATPPKQQELPLGQDEAKNARRCLDSKQQQAGRESDDCSPSTPRPRSGPTEIPLVDHDGDHHQEPNGESGRSTVRRFGPSSRRPRTGSRGATGKAVRRTEGTRVHEGQPTRGRGRRIASAVRGAGYNKAEPERIPAGVPTTLPQPVAEQWRL